MLLMLLLQSSLIVPILLSFQRHAVAQDVPFSPCPLLGPRFPIPDTLSTSPVIQEGLQNLTDALDQYILAGDGTFGEIFPNTTSFSLMIFSSENVNSTDPFFFEYHYTAPSLRNASSGVKKVDADSVYRVGDLTSMFTVWLFLMEAGETFWDEPVSKWVPELASATQASESISKIQWDKITLGDLAAHLGGVGRYAPLAENPDIAILLKGLSNTTQTSPCEEASSECNRAEFLSYFGRRSPVFASGSTPIFSNAGFLILAYALESITGRAYVDLLNEAILKPLDMSSTTLLTPTDLSNAVIPSSSNLTRWSTPVPVEAPFNGLYSSPRDISTALRSILRSTNLPPAVTRRWLKPLSYTSNRANAVGRPWEIFSLTETPISPVIPVFQVRGNVGYYTSHIGLVPDYNVGFVIMAADSARNPDLNAHADIISVQMIPALEKNAVAQASNVFAGTYTSRSDMSLTIAQAEDSSPGLSVSRLVEGGRDLRAVYAKLAGVEPDNLSFRLYPTDLVEGSAQGKKMVFRASFQDVTALADAGTPTCETWRYIDEFQVGGEPLDRFVFEVNASGAVQVEVAAFGETMLKLPG
ncbi:beta-lactamase/transpeptidase-like protein [Polyplosphaeria fusca]|uniref:Beta-lactamase/transpeptidase-like protein n=1 Tax=Polyplosphaeria fusca TaxID=682080 RepID=A0A9P4QZF0_9PLEO|nr:beta-lactamase/transpeptidase-like protein [Polyplosphaeria fusca]